MKLQVIVNGQRVSVDVPDGDLTRAVLLGCREHIGKRGTLTALPHRKGELPAYTYVAEEGHPLQRSESCVTPD